MLRDSRTWEFASLPRSLQRQTGLKKKEKEKEKETGVYSEISELFCLLIRSSAASYLDTG